MYAVFPVMLALLVVIAPASSDAFAAGLTSPSPNGLTIPKGYKKWKLVGISHRKDNESLRAILGNAQELAFDFAVFAGGIEPSPFVQNLHFKKDTKGFLVTDEFLRVEENIFAIGDAAALKDTNGKPVPPTAQSAEQSGIIAAKNIINLIANRPLQKASIRLQGLAIALGGKYAILLTPFGFSFSGILGWIGKKAIEKYYKIPLKIKAKRGFEKLRQCQEHLTV